MTTLSSSTKKSGKSIYFLILFLILAAGIGTAFFLFFENKAPHITISEPGSHIGAKGEIVFSITDEGNGIRSVSVSVTQGATSKVLFSDIHPRKGYTGMIGMPLIEKALEFSPLDSGFKDGSATLTVSATDYSSRNFLKGNETVQSVEIVIDTTPPKINIIHSERYIKPGESGIVIYKVDDPETVHGINVNDAFSPGFLVGDGRDDTYIAYFGLPYDTQELQKSSVQAKDKAGNIREVPFSSNFKPNNFRIDRINVGDNFLNKKIPEFEQHYPEMKGDQVEKYLYTNNELRRQNNDFIKKLCANPHPERLWSGRFVRMSGSTRAGFADHRTYYYGDTPIDNQVHLGIDIASTRNADVKAAEKGIVIYSDYLGIYGNMVMIDHGQGVFSLYSHLSQLNVAVGDKVDQGVVLGLTGTSGMAGGDHLHFSMLIHGVFVTPKEWWDQHWINVTIDDPLAESRF